MRRAILVFVAISSFGASVTFGNPFVFSGIDEGGVGSATMAFSSTGPTNTLTVLLDNTSPTTLLSGTGVNAPGVTGFGFNAVEPIPGVASWALYAYGADKTTVVQIGGPGSSGDWVLNATIAGVTLDFLPTTAGENIQGALYNPLATAGFGAQPWFFTSAALELTFTSSFTLLVEPQGPGGQVSPFVRFQNVGAGGEGSLKLGGTPVPEPASLALVVLGLGSLGVWARSRRNSQVRES